MLFLKQPWRSCFVSVHSSPSRGDRCESGQGSGAGPADSGHSHPGRFRGSGNTTLLMHLRKVACEIALSRNTLYIQVKQSVSPGLPVHPTQFICATASCAALSGPIDLVTSGTKMQLAKGRKRETEKQADGENLLGRQWLSSGSSQKSASAPWVFLPAAPPAPRSRLTMLPLVRVFTRFVSLVLLLFIFKDATVTERKCY